MHTHAVLLLAATVLTTACDNHPPTGLTNSLPGSTTPRLIVVAGDGTSSPVDVTVSGIASVRVVDASNNPMTGVQVAFAVTVGGGSLTGAIQTTDAQGIATVGTFTPGPTPTANQIVATTGGINSLPITIYGAWQQNLSVGRVAACALGMLGTTQCWGDNSWAQLGATSAELGIAATGFATTPVAPASLANLGGLTYVTGDMHCGFARSNEWRCWGRDVGQSSTAVGEHTLPPTAAPSSVDWLRLSPGITSVCGLSRDFSVYCWGLNQGGEFGTLTSRLTTTATPIPADGTMKFASLTEGWTHTCGLVADGTAYCWGANLDGQLGIGVTDTARASPQRVATNLRFVQLSLGARYTCGITTAHRAYCWGKNTHGMLGDGTTTDRIVPTAVAGGNNLTSIQTSAAVIPGGLPSSISTPTAQGEAAHTCALTESGQALCWGWNAAGQLGDGTQTERLTPTLVATDLRFTALDLGDAFTCGTRRFEVWCWGANARGQLGDGSGDGFRRTPGPVTIRP